MQPRQCGVGVNYLSVCDRVSGPDAEAAAKAADGIRQVLRRELREFTLEYACHPLDQQRWFQLLAAPAGGEAQMTSSANLGRRTTPFPLPGASRSIDEAN